MGPIGRLRSFLVGIHLISSMVANCPAPWGGSSDFFESDWRAACPSAPSSWLPGCKVTLFCPNGTIPTSYKFRNMVSKMECGSDSQWRDETGKVIQISEDNPDFLFCVPACVYYPDGSPYRYQVTVLPKEILNFTDPRDSSKTNYFIKRDDSFSMRCIGDNVLVYPRGQGGKVPLTGTSYTCNGVTQSTYNSYTSKDDIRIENFPNNCWYFCPLELANIAGSYDLLYATDAIRLPDGGMADVRCRPDYVYPPGTKAAERGYQKLKCNAVQNQLIDMVDNTVTKEEPCIRRGKPGECGQLNTTNLIVLSTNCQETDTGVKEPCSLTVRCKDGKHPTNPVYLSQNNGSQTLYCKDGLWFDEKGAYSGVMQCVDGCIREILKTVPISETTTNRITGEPIVCFNRTWYKQPPPYHPYYCDDLYPTADCEGVCRTQMPPPLGVKITNHTLTPPLSNIPDMENYIVSQSSIVYGCQEGYMYPPGSTPTLYGNRQELECRRQQLFDMNLNQAVPVVACIPITGCDVLEPKDNVILTYQTNCTMDKDTYNNGCVLKYDCAQGFYPMDDKYLVYDGQEMICNRPTAWYDLMKFQNVNQTLTCLRGCVKLDIEKIVEQSKNRTISIDVIDVEDTAGEKHTCFAVTTINLVRQMMNEFMKRNNKYYCEFNNTNQSTVITLEGAYDCGGSCLALDTSAFPPGLKLIETPSTFVYNGKTYVGGSKTYVFQCENGKNVFGKPPSYQQKLQCSGPFYTNPDTGETTLAFNATILKGCDKTPSCTVKNSTIIVISSDCQLSNNTVEVGCTVNMTCLPGWYPIDTTTVRNNQQSLICNITTENKVTWISVSVGETAEQLDCEPSNCKVPSGTDKVEVTSNCQIINEVVTTNCTVTEQCKEGLGPVNITGVMDGKKTSYCATIYGKQGQLVNIVVGTPLGPLECTDAPKCPVRPNSTAVVATTSCQSIGDQGSVSTGCSMTETCKEGYFPVNTSDVVKNTQTTVCNVTTDGKATWINIAIGTPIPPLNCSPPCNTTTPPGTKLSHNCTVVQGGVIVGCNASLVCEDDLVTISSDGKRVTNLTCSGDGKNSSWIDITIGQPAKLTECGCPPPFGTNRTTINSNCYQPGVGGPPGCALNATCAPGTAPIYGTTTEKMNNTLICQKDTRTGKATWIDISVGKPFAGKDCLNLCPATISIPNAHLLTTCLQQQGDYQVDCPAWIECDENFYGNAKYNYRSVVNVTCKNITSNNSTFIELSTGQPVENFCENKECQPITEPNMVNKTNCQVVGGVTTKNCSVDVTCADGTFPVHTAERNTINATLYCNKTTGTQNATWIVISIGMPYDPSPCAPVCKLTQVPHATPKTECALKDGGYQVGCVVNWKCNEGYTGNNVKYQYNSLINISCNTTDWKNSTFVEITTGQPLDPEGFCGPKPTTPVPIACPPIETSNNNVSSDCYVQGMGAPLDCMANVTCRSETFPVHINGKENATTTVKCQNNPTTQKVTWIDISIGQPYKASDACLPPCPFKQINHTSPTSECVKQSGDTYQVNCTVQLQCEPDYVSFNIKYNYSSLVNITCTKQTTTNSTFIEITTGQPVEQKICEKPCPPIYTNNSLVSSSCYLISTGGPLGCAANVTCLPGTYPIYTGKGTGITTTVRCEKLENGTYSWTDISLGQPTDGKHCAPPCEPVNVPRTKTSYSCNALSDERYQVGCNATLECEEGYVPVSINSEENRVTQLQCKETTTNKSSFIDISIGQPVTGELCVAKTTTSTVASTTSKPSSWCTLWLNETGVKLSGSGNSDCVGETVYGNVIPGQWPIGQKFESACTVYITCTNWAFQVPAGYGYANKSIHIVCNKTSSDSDGNWYLVETGEPYRPMNCVNHTDDKSTPTTTTTGPQTTTTPASVPVCPEPNPGPGVIQTGQSCPASSGYTVGCKKDFVCGEGAFPSTPGAQTNNSAVCQLIGSQPTWVDPGTSQPYKQLDCPTPMVCTPIAIDRSTTHVTNRTCTPSNGAVAIHPENCVVDVECLNGYYPTDVPLRDYKEHKAECLKNPTTGKYEWYDKTLNNWWKIYTCKKGCLNETTGVITSNTTQLGNRICNFTTLPKGTGKYTCNLKDVTSSNCSDTCQKLVVLSPLRIVHKPEFIIGTAPIGGQYEVYCPDGKVWRGTTNPSKNFTCAGEGTYSTTGKTGITVVVNECVEPDDNHGQNCTLSLVDGNEIVWSTCNTDDVTYAANCLVSIRCKNGTYPRTPTPSQLQMCDNNTGEWIDPGTRRPVRPYYCDDNCKVVSSVVNKTTTTTVRLANATAVCDIYTLIPGMINYTCNNSFIDPADPIVKITCTNTCERIGLEVNLTNTRTVPDLIYDKVPLSGQTEVQCPPGTIFRETGSRTNWYTCIADGTYNGPNGTTGLNRVPNTCVDANPPKNSIGCSEMPLDSSTIIINETCKPFEGTSIYPKNCTCDVRCKTLSGMYPVPKTNEKFGWHSVECWYDAGKNTFFWYDLTLNVQWTPYKCVDGCINETESLTYVNTSIIAEVVDDRTIICNFTSVPHKTGPYYCNTDGDIVDGTTSCNGTCPPLVVTDPLSVGKEPKPRIYKELVLSDDTYHIFCPEGTYYNDTCNSTRKYICTDDGTYTSGSTTGITVAIDNCEDVEDGTPNCTLTAGEGVEINQKYKKCPPRDSDTYGISCAVELRCIKGYYPAVKTVITQDRYCTNKGDKESTWWLFEPDVKAPDFGPCKKGCIEDPKQYITKNKKESRKINGVTSICDVSYIDVALVEKLCNKSSVKPDGEVSRSCTNTCPPLEMGPGMTYIPPSPHFFHGLVIRWDRYTVQCPNGKVWPETNTERKEFTCNADGTYNTTTERGLKISLDKCVEKVTTTTGIMTTTTTTTIPTTATATVPTCPDRAVPPKGTVYYGYNCTAGKNYNGCQLSYKCEFGWYPVKEEDQKLLNRTAVCNGKIWIDPSIGKAFEEFGCSKGCLNYTASVPTETRSDQQIQIGDTTVCCNWTYIRGINKLYYCNYTAALSVKCTETCQPLMVAQPPLTVVLYPVRRNPKLDLIFRGTKYTISCPSGKVYQGTNESYRNYTCDYNGKYYTEYAGDLTAADNTCVDVPANTPTCTLASATAPVQQTSPNCGQVTDGKYAVSCVVYQSCAKGNYPSVVEDQAYLNQTIECKLQNGAAVWENIRTGKVVTTPYSCTPGCLNTVATNLITKVDVMTCDVSSIPLGSISYQCDGMQYYPDGVKKSNCTPGCLPPSYNETYVETNNPTTYYYYVSPQTTYHVFCPPGLRFTTTFTINQTLICQPDGSYISSAGAKIIPGVSGTIGECVNPPLSETRESYDGDKNLPTEKLKNPGIEATRVPYDPYGKYSGRVFPSSPTNMCCCHLCCWFYVSTQGYMLFICKYGENTLGKDM